MTTTTWDAGRASTTPLARLRHQAHVVRVIAGAEFKLKYSGSALGYVWSLIKPLGLFAMLYIVFGRFFKLTVGFKDYPLYLLIGIVLWTYFADATTLTLSSLVNRATLIWKLSFPRILVPISTTVSVGITFLVNLVAVGAFVAAARVAPRPAWLLLPFLLIELYLVTLGVGLVLATLFVRLRDIGQVWELALQLLFYASPIIYPVGFLPPWAKPVAFLSPFVQVIQDTRAIVLPGPQSITAPDIYGTAWGELLPLGVGAVVIAIGFALFRQQSPWFAERL